MGACLFNLRRTLDSGVGDGDNGNPMAPRANGGVVKDKTLMEIASSFRDGILDGESSELMCAAVCWPLSALLRGVYRFPCECVESDLGHINHIWISLPDGRALDPTADQFSTSESPLPPVYLGLPLAIHRPAS